MSANIKELHRRLFEEGIADGNEAVIDELVAEDYVNYNWPAPAPGREGFKQVTRAFHVAFPDITVTLEDVVAEGDLVASRGVLHGTHRGEFQGIPATGRTVAVPYIDIWRLKNGQFTENWVQMDMMGMMQQLGVAPA
jgi:steroid delta-isomerase-like uncharacterized protein